MSMWQPTTYLCGSPSHTYVTANHIPERGGGCLFLPRSVCHRPWKRTTDLFYCLVYSTMVCVPQTMEEGLAFCNSPLEESSTPNSPLERGGGCLFLPRSVCHRPWKRTTDLFYCLVYSTKACVPQTMEEGLAFCNSPLEESSTPNSPLESRAVAF